VPPWFTQTVDVELRIGRHFQELGNAHRAVLVDVPAVRQHDLLEGRPVLLFDRRQHRLLALHQHVRGLREGRCGGRSGFDG
jgi:hypothetical protein